MDVIWNSKNEHLREKINIILTDVNKLVDITVDMSFTINSSSPARSGHGVW